MKPLFLLGLLCLSLSASAQETNPIIGIWTRNDAESTAPGQPPRTEVRQYREGPDGYVVGLAVWVTANGTPGFLQFTAKSDGKFYPEHDWGALSALQANGQESPLTYAETIIDARTIEWVDKANGVITGSGTKTFSEDGRKMTILVNVPQRDGSTLSYTLVYDKQ